MSMLILISIPMMIIISALHFSVQLMVGSRVSTVLSAYRNDPDLSFLFHSKEEELFNRPKLTIEELMKSDEVKEYYGESPDLSDIAAKNKGKMKEGKVRIRKSLSELLCSKSPSFASAVIGSSVRYRSDNDNSLRLSMHVSICLR